MSDTWTATSTAGAPAGRYGQGTVWTGSEMVVWGGITFGYSSNGGRYCALLGTIYYYDADADGQGDPEGGVPSCQQPPDFVDNAGDCNDSDGNVWSPPSEARDLLFLDNVTLEWTAPQAAGGLQVWYDTIRAADPNQFNSAAACVDSNEPDTTTLDASPLDVGAAFFYLVRPENDCPDGEWNLGTDSDGVPRNAIDCP